MNEQAVELTQPETDRFKSSLADRGGRVVPLGYQLAGVGLNLISRFNHEWVAEILSDFWFTVFKKTPKPWVEKFWQQAEKRVELEFGDNSIPVYLWGNGPLVVMMHGWSGSGTQYRKFIPALVEAGYQVALFDAPAHGSNPGKRADLVDFCDALIAIQQQIGSLDTVVAHSLGAMAAVYATHRGLHVNRLVLLAPHLDVEKMFDSYRRLLGLNTKLAGRFNSIIGRRMADILGSDDPWGLLTPDALLQDSDIPGLLVYDQADEEIPQQQFENIVRHWKESSVIKTQDLGHSRLLKDAVVIRQVVNYLTGTGLRVP